MQKNNWYQVKNSDEIITPGLLVYPDRIKKNIESMISLSGSPNRLIPHVKTYKMKEIVKFGHPSLKLNSTDVTQFDDDLVNLVNEMIGCSMLLRVSCYCWRPHLHGVRAHATPHDA